MQLVHGFAIVKNPTRPTAANELAVYRLKGIDENTRTRDAAGNLRNKCGDQSCAIHSGYGKTFCDMDALGTQQRQGSLTNFERWNSKLVSAQRARWFQP